MRSARPKSKPTRSSTRESPSSRSATGECNLPHGAKLRALPLPSSSFPFLLFLLFLFPLFSSSPTSAKAGDTRQIEKGDPSPIRSSYGLPRGVSNPILRRFDATPLRHYHHRALRFRASDGTRLGGTLVLHPTLPPRGSLLLLHGLFSRSNLDDAGRLARLGYAVLAYDMRGHGVSSGVWRLGPSVDDVAAALRCLKTHDGGRLAYLPTFGFGKSIGGLILNRAKARLPQLRAICVVAAPYSVSTLGKPLARRLRRFRRPPAMFDFVAKTFLDSRRFYKMRRARPPVETWQDEENPDRLSVIAQLDLARGLNLRFGRGRVTSASALIEDFTRDFRMVPTNDGLYLFAEHDSLTRKDLPRIRRVLAGRSNRIVVLEGLAHYPDAEQRRRYVKAIRERVREFFGARALPDSPLLERIWRRRRKTAPSHDRARRDRH